jgi:hypothetical protein
MCCARPIQSARAQSYAGNENRMSVKLGQYKGAQVSVFLPLCFPLILLWLKTFSRGRKQTAKSKTEPSGPFTAMITRTTTHKLWKTLVFFVIARGKQTRRKSNSWSIRDNVPTPASFYRLVLAAIGKVIGFPLLCFLLMCASLVFTTTAGVSRRLWKQVG